MRRPTKAEIEEITINIMRDIFNGKHTSSLFADHE
jgi:hypothetical protein